MLVHICCSVDSHFFITELCKLYPNEELIGFFYDPNIHPKDEYELRYLDVKRSCDKLGIKLYKGKYEYEKWLEATRGFENEPERGLRCEICFHQRLSKTVKFAQKIGQKRLTTTLLASPKKDIKQLEQALKKECEASHIDFVALNFRQNGGTQRQFELAKKEKLYHQNYCGCLFALLQQNKPFIDELMSPISRQILPASIQARLQFYKKVIALEKKGVRFKVEREKFLNYRLLRAVILVDKKPTKTHILFYSHFKNAKTAFLQEQRVKNSLHIFKDEVIFWDFEYFNALCKHKFQSFEAFLKKPLSVEKEITLRQKCFGNYHLSPIIICENLPQGRVEISAKSEIYFDTREKIIILP